MGSGQKSQILMVNIYVDMEHVHLQVALFILPRYILIQLDGASLGATRCFSGIKNAITKPHETQGRRHHNHEFNPSYKHVAS